MRSCAFFNPREDLPSSWAAASRSSASVRERIIRSTASACTMSMRPFRNALFVNSPGSASLRVVPLLRASCRSLSISISIRGRLPKVCISTTSSLVYEHGAFITYMEAGAVTRSPRSIRPLSERYVPVVFVCGGGLSSVNTFVVQERASSPLILMMVLGELPQGVETARIVSFWVFKTFISFSPPSSV